jgi:hypothetical protein
MWPLILMAIGTAMKYKAGRDATKRQEELTNMMQAYKTDKAAEGRSSIENYLKDRNPKAMQAEAKDARQDITASLTGRVDATNKFEAEPAGKVSDRYTRTVAAGSQRNADKISRIIGQLSAIGTPGETKFRDSLRFGQAGSDVDNANIASNNVGNAYMTDIGNVRPNKTLMMLGSMAQAAGSYGMSTGGVGAEQPGAPVEDRTIPPDTAAGGSPFAAQYFKPKTRMSARPKLYG